MPEGAKMEKVTVVFFPSAGEPYSPTEVFLPPDGKLTVRQVLESSKYVPPGRYVAQAEDGRFLAADDVVTAGLVLRVGTNPRDFLLEG